MALLITRKGKVTHVIVGDYGRILIPDLTNFRQGPGRLKGLRCVHTHLKGEPLSTEDLTDMVLLGLDLMVCIGVDSNGFPGPIFFGNILPSDISGKGWSVNKVPNMGQLDVDFLELINSLEKELARTSGSGRLVKRRQRAILVGVDTGPKWRQEESLDELEGLAVSDGLEVVGREIQSINRKDPRFLIKRGKLSELVLKCIQKGAELMIFNDELSPAQVKSLTDFTEMKIIDRSQLILDIFARRAVSREGKIQVELAQLKYMMPRLASKNTALSRLTGGIGGRGPGETKLEINRRRVRERIAKLNNELEQIRRGRKERRRLRNEKEMPVISIVGYTNAGKSTLLNTLTNSQVGAGDRPFETLDPSSRRLRFPREHEAIVTDTVGFIRDLPASLMEAFAATLEELRDADLILHVVDAKSPRMDDQVKTVEEILTKLDINGVPRLLLLNKADLLEPHEVEIMAKKIGGIAISAINPPSLSKLTKEIESLIWLHSSSHQT